MKASLRKRAESLLKKSPVDKPAPPARDVQELVHELQVHQAELEIQNEELRHAQQELTEARDRYMNLYQSVPVGCLTLDAQRTIQDANTAAVEMLCGQDQSLTAQRLDRFVAPEDADDCYLLLRQVLKTSQRQRRDIRFRRGDGSGFWADMVILPPQPPGPAAGLRITLSDITARKRAEEVSLKTAAEIQAVNAALTDSRRAALNLMNDAVESRHQAEQAAAALKASEQRMQQALRVSHSFTFDWEPATDRVLRSGSCEPILGIAGDEALHEPARNYFQRIHPDDRERFTQGLHALTPDASAYTIEYRVVRPDGSVVVLSEEGLALFTEAGQLQRVLGVATDITDRKRAEEQLQKHAAMLEQMNAELSHFNRVSVGRELRMIELKREINALCAAAGQPARYRVDFEQEEPAG